MAFHAAFLAQSHQVPDEPNHLQIIWKEGAVHNSAGCINESLSDYKHKEATFFLRPYCRFQVTIHIFWTVNFRDSAVSPTLLWEATLQSPTHRIALYILLYYGPQSNMMENYYKL
jgi:hypothetical protein